jgi:hypothetical protein
MQLQKEETQRAPSPGVIPPDLECGTCHQSVVVCRVCGEYADCHDHKACPEPVWEVEEPEGVEVLPATYLSPAESEDVCRRCPGRASVADGGDRDGE